LFIASWLMIEKVSSVSFLLWLVLMLTGAVMCFYAGLCRSRWFLLPSLAAMIVVVGVLVAVFRGA